MELTDTLILKRCPHCSIANPHIKRKTSFATNHVNGGRSRLWHIYVCQTCGGVISAAGLRESSRMLEMYPEIISVDDCIPEKVKNFLNQSMETLHAPSGSIMLSASAIDAMLKDKGYKIDSLYKRIEKAVEDHLITEGMSKWAHQIRLEANDQRHADENTNSPTEEDAKRIKDFAFALAEFLYVLPHKVEKALKETSSQ